MTLATPELQLEHLFVDVALSEAVWMLVRDTHTEHNINHR